MSKNDTFVCKGIAILLLYIHHIFYTYDTFSAYNVVFSPFSVDFVLWFAQACKICVAIFIFLTAYGTTLQMNQRRFNNETQLSQYIFSRYIRLMANFWIIFIIAQCFSFMGRNTIDIYGENLDWSILYILIDFLGLANFFGTPTLNETWWYMSVAIFLIFTMPIFIKFVKSTGFLAIPLAILLPTFFSISVYTPIGWYLLTIVLGILFAEYKLFERITHYLNYSLYKQIVGGFAIIVGWCVLIVFRSKFGYVNIADGILAILTCLICYLYLSKLPILSSILKVIGIHSGNLFLIHTFIVSYYTKDFTYSFKYSFLILIVAIISTLCISKLIELLKKLLHYDSQIYKTIQQINSIIEKLSNINTTKETP